MKNFSSSIQRPKPGTRTEYIARLTYYDKTGKRKDVSKSAVTHWDARKELQDRRKTIFVDTGSLDNLKWLCRASNSCR